MCKGRRGGGLGKGPRCSGAGQQSVHLQPEMSDDNMAGGSEVSSAELEGLGVAVDLDLSGSRSTSGERGTRGEKACMVITRHNKRHQGIEERLPSIGFDMYDTPQLHGGRIRALDSHESNAPAHVSQGAG